MNVLFRAAEIPSKLRERSEKCSKQQKIQNTEALHYEEENSNYFQDQDKPYEILFPHKLPQLNSNPDEKLHKKIETNNPANEYNVPIILEVPDNREIAESIENDWKRKGSDGNYWKTTESNETTLNTIEHLQHDESNFRSDKSKGIILQDEKLESIAVIRNGSIISMDKMKSKFAAKQKTKIVFKIWHRKQNKNISKMKIKKSLHQVRKSYEDSPKNNR